MNPRFLHPIILLALLIVPLASGQATLGAATGTSPRATYQAIGPAVQMYYQMINNTSFETGTTPWTLISYNNYTPGVSIVPPGYNDNSAVQLNVNSGNLTTDSHLTLLQDFSQRTIAFASGLRLRAAGQVQTLKGNATTDRVEVSLTLSSSDGNLARIHYVLATRISLPANTTSDAYIAVQGYGSAGWIPIDRNVPSDAARSFPSIFGSLSAVKDARLSVFSTSQGNATYDPRIKYYESDRNQNWDANETVVFDPDADGHYLLGDRLLYNGTTSPSPGQLLNNDTRIKYVDTNLNGFWDTGEPIVYDLKNEGVYDLLLDPIICGPQPPKPCSGNLIAGSLLQDPIHLKTSALFDQIELYSLNGSIDWARNGGFETGDLTGWGNIAGFKVATVPTHSGSYSVNGTATGTPAALAQSIDSRPVIDSTTSLQASGYVGKMTGTSSSDRADIWLGLVDSSPQANPLSIYYDFKTGTGTLPSNTTDIMYHRIVNYGMLGQWLSLTQNLLPETQYFDSTGHTGPYRIEAAVLEVSAATGQTTSAIFDDLSILTVNRPTYYAVDSLNSTYVYNANKPPQGTFYFSIPVGQSVLNITSANGTLLQTSDYTTGPVQGSLQITVPTSTGLKYPSPGTWHIYTISKNTLANLLATGPGSTSPSSSFNPSTTVNFASQTKDPTGVPIAGSNVTLIFSAGNAIFTGKTDSQGWVNQTNIVLPSTPGTLTLEAITVSSSYIGLRTIQLTTSNPIPWAVIAYISIAAGAAILFGLILLMRRRKGRSAPSQSAIQPNKPKQKTVPQKGK